MPRNVLSFTNAGSIRSGSVTVAQIPKSILVRRVNAKSSSRVTGKDLVCTTLL
jgi:hypothetical protein